jgi:hypothetical protein
MVAEFNLNRSFTNTSVPSILTETVKDVFQSLTSRNEKDDCKQPERSLLIDQIVKSENSLFLKKCGFLILVDQLLTQGENEVNTIHCKKKVTMAQKLLGSFSSSKIVITPSNEVYAQQFIEKILEKAVAATETQNTPPIPTPLIKSASELKSRGNELFKSWEKNLPNPFDTFHNFISSWQEFAKLTLQERLKSLIEK